MQLKQFTWIDPQKLIIRNTSCSNQKYFMWMEFLCKNSYSSLICFSPALHFKGY